MATIHEDLDHFYQTNHLARTVFDSQSRRELMEEDLEAAKYVRIILMSILTLGTVAGALTVLSIF